MVEDTLINFKIFYHLKLVRVEVLTGSAMQKSTHFSIL